MKRAGPFAALAVALATTACSGGGGDSFALDGSPRPPDLAGVVTGVDREHLVVDGGRRLRLAGDLASFSTYDLIATPVLHHRGRYVHAGLDGDRVEWVASIGVVVRAEGRAPVVFYNGDLVDVDDGEATFRDGTVLTLAEGVTAPAGTAALRAEIDPETDEVVRLAPQ